MFTVGSLFSGIGGIDLAFSWAGFDVRWQVEIEPFCQAVLRKHAAQYWPNARIHDDVTKVTGGELGSVDILVGGFPCQDISTAGGRKGIKQGTRSGLWFEFARLISEIRPRIVLLENVAAISTLGGAQVIADLASMGFDAEWGIIPASATGAPHKRNRWFCVAYPQRTRRRQSDGRGWGDQDYQEWIGTSPESGWNELAVRADANCKSMGYPHCQRQSQPQGSESRIRGRIEYDGEAMGNADSGRRYERRAEQQVWIGQRSSIGTGNRHAQSIMGSAVDGLSRRLDIDRWPARPGEEQHQWEAPRTVTSKIPNRIAQLKALGNAVVPQVVYPIAVAIREQLEISQR